MKYEQIIFEDVTRDLVDKADSETMKNMIYSQIRTLKEQGKRTKDEKRRDNMFFALNVLNKIVSNSIKYEQMVK